MTYWLAALVLDLAAGEPPARAHPVVWLGRLLAWLESLAPEREREELRHGVVLAAVPAAAAAAAALATRSLPSAVLRAAATVWLLKTTFSLRALLERTRAVERALEAGETEAARASLRDLVSRDQSRLDATEMCSAAIESVAENLTDSYVAPLLAYAVGGLPLAAAYRAVNTADAMVGYHGRYERLGKASARADDVLNLVPARLAAGALVAAAPLAGLDVRRGWEVAWREHARTESPNAGWTMSAAAGALGVRLEKVGAYRLGDGRPPVAGDIARARRLVATAAGLCTAAVLLVRR